MEAGRVDLGVEKLKVELVSRYLLKTTWSPILQRFQERVMPYLCACIDSTQCSRKVSSSCTLAGLKFGEGVAGLGCKWYVSMFIWCKGGWGEEGNDVAREGRDQRPIYDRTWKEDGDSVLNWYPDVSQFVRKLTFRQKVRGGSYFGNHGEGPNIRNTHQP